MKPTQRVFRRFRGAYASTLDLVEWELKIDVNCHRAHFPGIRHALVRMLQIVVGLGGIARASLVAAQVNSGSNAVPLASTP